jgi:hypothetical protein
VPRDVPCLGCWGEGQLQPVPRRLFRWALVHDSGLRRSLAGLNRLPLPGLAATALKPTAAYFARLVHADDLTERADLARLSASLDRVDSLIADGTIGAARSNAADSQIGTSVRVLLACEDLRRHVERHPAAELALRLSAS